MDLSRKIFMTNKINDFQNCYKEAIFHSLLGGKLALYNSISYC